MEYTKPWLSVGEQVDRLTEHGVSIGSREMAVGLLRTVGYYRLTGYLYPFRRSDICEVGGRARVRVLASYRDGAKIEDAARSIVFDRKLRLLALDAVEQIEVCLRTQVAHTIGRLGPFAHEGPEAFVPGFSESATDSDGKGFALSKHAAWLARVEQRQKASDEVFVAHFRDKHDGRMPIWALTEILELGDLSRLYRGLRNDLATEIAGAFHVPTKRLMASWVAAVNYVRNVSAHHARLFNRKLVTAPKRPRPGDVPMLDHLSSGGAPKEFGIYNCLAVMAYLVRVTSPGSGWPSRARSLLQAFPAVGHLHIGSMGIAPEWLNEPLWTSRDPAPSPP